MLLKVFIYKYDLVQIVICTKSYPYGMILRYKKQLILY